MTTIPPELKYATSHEWSKLEDNDIVRVGITDFAQAQLGDLVYLDLPEVGVKLKAGEQCAVVESVKAASDLYSPVSGEVVSVNADIADELEKINEDPYNAWLFCVKAENIDELSALLSAADYEKMIND